MAGVLGMLGLLALTRLVLCPCALFCRHHLKESVQTALNMPGPVEHRFLPWEQGKHHQRGSR